MDMGSRIISAICLNRDRKCLGKRNLSVNSSNECEYERVYHWFTFKEIGERIINFSCGLEHMIKPRQCLGICSFNRPEWIIVDFSCILQSLISVPIDHKINDKDLCLVINTTEIQILVCDKNILERLTKLNKNVPGLQHIICMDDVSKTEGNRNNYDFSITNMNDIENNGFHKKYKDYIVNEDDDCISIVYTSGTSGSAKGAMLSENVFRMTYSKQTELRNVEHVKYCYRSLTSITERKSAIESFLRGGSTGFSSGNFDEIIEEINLVQPTSFSAPPILWNKIYSEYKTVSSFKNDINQEILLDSFSKLIPKSCKVLSIGGAMVNLKVIGFMKKCFPHCKIVEVYGTTECGRIAINYKFVDNVIDYRLQSVEEMDYTINDKPFPRGELFVKTKQMFSGYFRNIEETKSSLTGDGFYCTGDIVQLQSNDDGTSNIYVIDRKKNFFKLSQGKFVSAEYLEGIYMQSLFVHQIYIHGNYQDNCVRAVIVPNEEYLRKYFLKNNFDENDKKLISSEIMKDLNKIASQNSLELYEMPSEIIIDFQPFTVENGLLTSSMKFCRHRLLTYYSKKKINSQLKTIVKNLMENEISTYVDNERSLFMNGLDSLTGLRLSKQIFNDLGIQIPIELFYQSNMNFEKLSNFIENSSEECFLRENIIQQLINDSEMALDIRINKIKLFEEYPSTIFLTGVTGFIGAFLLVELIKFYPTSTKFICLVRCKSSIDPLDRIKRTLTFYKLWNDDFASQVHPIEGDLSKVNLGLDQKTYENLSENVDLIVHCGAFVNFLLPYEKLYPSNVYGTLQIVRFASHSSFSIPIIFISTMSATSNENNLDHLKNGYAQTKWVAEKLLQRVNDRGLPVTIFRLGSIGPSSINGASNQSDIYSLFLNKIIKLKCYPEAILDLNYNQLPVDYAVRSIIYLYQNRYEKLENAYHIFNRHHGISLGDIIKGFSDLNIEIRSISDDTWKNEIISQSKEKYFIEYIEKFIVNKSLNHMNHIDEQVNIPFNSFIFDENYVYRWLKFILNSCF